MREWFLGAVLSVLPWVASAGANAELRPMTFEDILAQREITEVRIQPDASRVAFVVKDARIVEDNYVSTLYVRQIAGNGQETVIARGKDIRNVRWRPGSDEISYWDGSEGALVIRDVRNQRFGSLTLENLDIESAPSSFEWSEDGIRMAAFVPYVEANPSEPYLYRDMHYGGSNNPHLLPEYELVVYASDGTIVCRSGATRWAQPSGLVWGPDGGVVAFTDYRRNVQTGNAWSDAVIADADSCLQSGSLHERSFVRFGASDTELLSVVTKAPLQPDGSFIFSSRGHSMLRARLDGDAFIEEPLIEIEADEESDDPALILDTIFFRAGSVIVEAHDRSVRSLFRLRDGELSRIDRSGKRLSGCSVAASGPYASCVVESVTEPPEVGLVDLRDGSVVRLTRLNAAMDRIRLGKVERVAVKSDRGKDVTMYVVYPTDYRKGRRYPALILTYGFNNGFISQAQYITSYAPQVYAARGYVTLLWNYPRDVGGSAGDLAAQARDLQLGQFETIKHSVAMLVERGLADPDRIGIAGHSMGSHWADYAITHSTLFAVSASHSPGGYTPIAYWRGHAMWRRRLDHIFGGPPVGDSLPAWQALSPALFPPPKIPQLREVPDSEINAEFAFRCWADAGAPVELVAYPNESHVFSRPQSRLYSLDLNADWFDFWLRGVEDPSPAKRERYERWRAMRAAGLPGS